MKMLYFILLLSIKLFTNVAFNVKLLQSYNYYNDALHMIDRFNKMSPIENKNPQNYRTS